MCPTAVTITAITRPCANATATSPPRPPSGGPVSTMTAPAPMKTRANVPMNSAMACCADLDQRGPPRSSSTWSAWETARGRRHAARRIRRVKVLAGLRRSEDAPADGGLGGQRRARPGRGQRCSWRPPDGLQGIAPDAGATSRRSSSRRSPAARPGPSPWPRTCGARPSRTRVGSSSCSTGPGLVAGPVVGRRRLVHQARGPVRPGGHGHRPGAAKPNTSRCRARRPREDQGHARGLRTRGPGPADRRLERPLPLGRRGRSTTTTPPC